MAQSQHPHSGQAGRQSRDRELGAPSWGRERPSSPARKLTNNTQEQKDPGPHGGSPLGSGGKGGELRLCPPSLPCPPLAPQGWGRGRPPLSLPPPRRRLPAPCSPGVSACWKLLEAAAVLACLCLCHLSGYLPASLVICRSELPLSTWLPSHLSYCPTCPPPSVCLSQTGS